MKKTIKSNMTGEQLRAIRKECELSAMGLAKYLGISNHYVYQLEYGRYEISQEIADKAIELKNFFNKS